MISEVKKQLVQKPFAASGIWSTLQMAKDAAEKSEGRLSTVEGFLCFEIVKSVDGEYTEPFMTPGD